MGRYKAAAETAERAEEELKGEKRKLQREVTIGPYRVPGRGVREQGRGGDAERHGQLLDAFPGLVR